LPRTTRPARLVATAAALAIGSTPLLLSMGAGATAAAHAARPAPAPAPIKVDLLAINDFHGQLEQLDGTKTSSGRVPTPSGDVNAGGAAYLAWHLDALRADAADRGAQTFTVSAGDNIGATPLLSAAFHDEPTIETLNALGLDITSVGNHEFDEGWRELVRMQKGGCIDDGDGANNQNSCPDGTFQGASFDYLSANVIRKKTGDTLFPAYVVRKIGTSDGKPVKMAFVGLTLEDTPNIVTASGVKGLEFIDENEAVKRVLPELRKQGIKSIVVLLHQGGVPASGTKEYNGCADVTGPGRDIAESLPSAVDVVITGHTHQAYNCMVTDPKGKQRLFTSAFSIGRLITDLSLQVDRSTGDVIRPLASEPQSDVYMAENHIVTNGPGTKPRAGILNLIAHYTDLVAPIANRVLGHIAPADEQNGVTRTPDADGESPLGNLIADAQLADDSTVTGGQTPTMAFMNPGGIRADLTENEDKAVTFGTAFSVQPFNNYMVSVTMTGQDILDLLNQQWNGKNEGDATKWKILQIAGITYTYDKTLAAQPDVDALVPGSVMVDSDGDGTTDTAIDPAASYRVVTNNFLVGGGDGFGAFTNGTDQYYGGLDIDAFADYLAAHDPYTPGPTDRISSVS